MNLVYNVGSTNGTISAGSPRYFWLDDVVLEEDVTYSGYRFGFNGQEKDDEVAGAGNINTALFWEYDTRLGRRWNIDPKHYAYESPFSVMGDNPILRTDIYGDKWKDKKDEYMAKDLGKKLDGRARSLREAELRSEKLAKKYKGKDEEKYNYHLEQARIAKEGVADMKKAQAELLEMGSENVEQVFHFEEIDEKAPLAHTYMDKDGVINMQYKNDDLAIHEANHGYQYFTGRMKYTREGTEFNDIHDELRAYKRQYFFSPKSVLDLDLDDGTKIQSYQRLTLENIHKIVATDEQTGLQTKPYKDHSDNDNPLLKDPTQ